MERDRSLLLSFAHPDDESFLAAGTICKYCEEGVRVALLCATRGGAGKLGEPPVCSREELPVVREAELRAAAASLGVQDLEILDFADRHLGTVPPDDLRRPLVNIIRRARPQVVITFDPQGANLHPDHIAISRYTSDAVAIASDSRWFPELGPWHSVQRLVWVGPVRPWDGSPEERLIDRPAVDFLIDVRKWWKQKAKALKAHRTQYHSIDRHYFHKPDPEGAMSHEIFRQGWGPCLEKRPEADLFCSICD